MKVRERIDEHQEKSSKKLGNIRLYIAALLALIPSMNVQSEDELQTKNKDVPAVYQKMNTPTDVSEAIEVSNEELFKSTFAKAIAPINSLKDIPVGGIKLNYPSATTLPKTIDFFPKKMVADTLPYSIIQIGNDMYTVTPDLGFKVDDMYLDATTFYVKVSMDSRFGEVTKTTTKDKKSELGQYIRDVYENGEDGWYLGSTVEKIPEADKKQFLEAFNKMNK